MLNESGQNAYLGPNSGGTTVFRIMLATGFPQIQYQHPELSEIFFIKHRYWVLSDDCLLPIRKSHSFVPYSIDEVSNRF